MWTDTRVHTFRHFRVSTSPSLRVLRPWEYMEEIDADMGINNVKNPRRGDVSGVYMYSPAGRRDKTHTLLLVLFSVTFCIFFPIFVHVYLYTCSNPNTEFEVLHTEHKRHIVFPRLPLQPQCTFTPPAFFYFSGLFFFHSISSKHLSPSPSLSPENHYLSPSIPEPFSVSVSFSALVTK